jgi:hypothetical protein
MRHSKEDERTAQQQMGKTIMDQPSGCRRKHSLNREQSHHRRRGIMATATSSPGSSAAMSSKSGSPGSLKSGSPAQGPNHQQQNQQQRDHHDEKLFWQTIASLAQDQALQKFIHSPSANRTQILQLFIDSYFTMHALHNHSSLVNIFHWMAPQTPAMVSARDALCLIHLAVRNRDERMLMEGRVRHGVALRCLNDALQQKGEVDDSVIGAAYTVGQCEVSPFLELRRNEVVVCQ